MGHSRLHRCATRQLTRQFERVSAEQELQPAAQNVVDDAKYFELRRVVEHPAHLMNSGSTSSIKIKIENPPVWTKTFRCRSERPEQDIER